MDPKAEILKILKDNKNYLHQKFFVVDIALFGSYSRDDFSSESDVDIIVNTSRPLGFDFVNLAFELEKLLNKKVEIRTKNSLKPEHYKEIEQDLIYV